MKPVSFHVRIGLENAATADPNGDSLESVRARYEISRILQCVAMDVSLAFGRDLSPETPHKIRDINGNSCGVWYTMRDPE